MDRPVTMRDLRRAIRRDKKANRLNPGLSPELAGEFKANQCSQTVTEEGKRLIQKWNQRLGQGLDQKRELNERSLHQSGPPTGEFNRADLNLRGQAVRPGAKNRCTASSIREAEQTEAGLWVRLTESNPGVNGGCGGDEINLSFCSLFFRLRGLRQVEAGRQFLSQDFHVRLVHQIGVIARNEVDLHSATSPVAPAHRRVWVRRRARRRFLRLEEGDSTRIAMQSVVLRRAQVVPEELDKTAGLGNIQLRGYQAGALRLF